MGDDRKQQKAPHGGPQAVADMFNVMEEELRERLLADLARRDPALAQDIQSRMFVFSHLAEFEKRDLQILIRALPSSLLALALRGADEKLRQAFLGNMSEKSAALLEEEMNAQGPRRLSEVEAARAKVVEIALALKKSGKIK